MNKMKEGVDYALLDAEENDKSVHVVLLRDPYKDVIIQFGKLKIGEENDDGTINANFSFEFVDTKDKKEKIFNTDEFNNYLGDILFSIIEDNLSENALEKVDPKEYMNEFREDFVEESDMERSVRTKSSTVRKR